MATTPPSDADESDFASIKVRRPDNDQLRERAEKFKTTTMNLVAIGVALFDELPEHRQWELVVEMKRRFPGRSKVPA